LIALGSKHGGLPPCFDTDMKPYFWLTPLFFCCALPAQADGLTSTRQQELTRFVRQECGFCHGLRLTGGLGSPLTAAALQDKPAEALIATILQGRTGTAMPGWAPYLSVADTQWIVNALVKGFPE
jgi:cytochrome c55X